MITASCWACCSWSHKRPAPRKLLVIFQGPGESLGRASHTHTPSLTGLAIVRCLDRNGESFSLLCPGSDGGAVRRKVCWVLSGRLLVCPQGSPVN